MATSIYTIDSIPGGRKKLVAVSGCFFLVGAGLALATVVIALQRLAAGALDDALGTLVFLGVAALLAGIGFWVGRAGYYDMWQFDAQNRTVIHLRRRLYSASVQDEFPFAGVAAVAISKTIGDDFAYSVDLVLQSGATVFISYDRRHATKLAKLLDVPTREG